MDSYLTKSIAGKFFINHLHTKLGAGVLMRGRIVGPVASELSPFYLCEIFPANDQDIGITTETIMQLDQLVGVYFYDSREAQLAAWNQTQRQILVSQQQAAKAKKRAIAHMMRQLTRTFESRGVKVVAQDDVRIAATKMWEAASALEMAGAGAVVEVEDDDGG